MMEQEKSLTKVRVSRKVIGMLFTEGGFAFKVIKGIPLGSEFVGIHMDGATGDYIAEFKIKHGGPDWMTVTYQTYQEMEVI